MNMKKNINIIVMTIALCCGEYIFTMDIEVERERANVDELVQMIEKTKQMLKGERSIIKAKEQLIKNLRQTVKEEEQIILSFLFDDKPELLSSALDGLKKSEEREIRAHDSLGKKHLKTFAKSRSDLKSLESSLRGMKQFILDAEQKLNSSETKELRDAELKLFEAKARRAARRKAEKEAAAG